MTTLDKTFLIIGALFLMTAAMLSAYGLHGLADSLTEADRLSWRWATQMQTYHGLGLILITLLALHIGPAKLLALARGLFVFGVIIFSGGIYLEQLGISAALGEIVPMGGASFMLAWGLVALAVLLKK
jgi:uncharacterized membrane protein YgdD (TMEM256/DUF423 family)